MSQQVSSRHLAGGCILWAVIMGGANPPAASSQPMPVGFEAVALGMAADQLTEARPKAAPFDIFGEPEAPAADRMRSFLEMGLTSPFFTQVTYTFAHEALCSVQFLGTGSAVNGAELRARLLQGAVRKWGEGYSRITYRESEIPGLDRERRLSPGLLWKLDESEILLRYSVDEPSEEQREPFVDITIFDRRCLPPRFKGWLTGIAAVRDTAHDGWFTELEAEVSPPLFN